MKNYIIGFIAVAALVVGVIGVSKQPVVKQGSQGSQGEQGVKGNDGYTPIKGVDYFDGKDGARGERGASGAIGMPSKLGAVSGPDIYSPYLNVNGVTEFYHRSAMTTGTTTPCAFKVTATSTLVTGVAKFNVGSTTAATVTFGRGTHSTATTTWLHNASLAANVQGTFAVPAATTTNQTFAPNEYLVVGMSGGNGTFSPTGACQAVFQQI